MLRSLAPLKNASRVLSSLRSSRSVETLSLLSQTRYEIVSLGSKSARPIAYTPHARLHSTNAGTTPTIYALSTASGRAAIAIVRCSGSACLDIYKTLCPNKPLPKPRRATLRTLYDPDTKTNRHDVLDPGALILYFPSPDTVTGEDVLEFHIHGGPAVVKAVLAGIAKSKSKGREDLNIRYAEPGEFTRRAFYNNRLDLTQVEALGDTLAAETEHQRILAIRNTTNTLNERYENWRSLLLEARGELEALIDFSEDQHFDDSPSEFTASVSTQVLQLKRRIQASINNAAKGELLRSGISVALLGAPNAGKSSLLNNIVGREAAIVSYEPGTTRDVVEVNVDIGGYFCKLGDLAGLRTSTKSTSTTSEVVGEIEKEGMRRAKARALEADVVVVVVEPKVQPHTQDGCSVTIDAEVLATLAEIDLTHQKVLFAINKVDLYSSVGASIPPLSMEDLPIELRQSPVFHVSCISSDADGKGIQPLLTGLKESFAQLTEASQVEDDMGSHSRGWDDSLGSSERQRLLLVKAVDHLDDFLECVGASGSGNGAPRESEEVDVVVAAESLRAAAQALGNITGRGEANDVEEVLGVVFEKFCVGK